VNPIRGSEHQEGGDEHKNSARRHSHSEAEDDEARIHGIAGEPKRSAGDQLVVGFRGGTDLGALTSGEQYQGPNRSNETDRDEPDRDGEAKYQRYGGPPGQVAGARREDQEEKGPCRRRKLQHVRSRCGARTGDL